ncbi:MAG: amidohydrolase family protein, partial [Rhizomicrobium sp.]
MLAIDEAIPPHMPWALAVDFFGPKAPDSALYALGLITIGLFDRFAKLKLVLGHLGEALPFWLYRLDYMHAATVRAQRYPSMKPLARTPSEYLRENIWITTSGMPWAPAILFCR